MLNPAFPRALLHSPLNEFQFSLGPNIQGTSNYGTGKVLIGNMLSQLCS